MSESNKHVKNPRPGATLPITSGMNPKEALFVDAYLQDFNAENAYIAAGGKKTPMMGRYIKQMMNRPQVYLAINAGMEKRRQKNEATAQDVIKQFAEIAFFDPIEFFNTDGTARPLDEIPENLRRIIAGVEIKVNGKGNYATETVKYQLPDKLKALEDLAKYFGLLRDKLDISGKVDITMLPEEEMNALIRKLAQETAIGITIDGEATQVEGT